MAVWGVALSPLSFAGLQEDQVLVLYNADDTSEIGLDLANYYKTFHPNVHLQPLTSGDPGNPLSTNDQVSADYYLNTIRPAVLNALQAAGASQIQCIVTTKGLPLRIKVDDSVPPQGAQWVQYSSLESELTRIDLIDSEIMMGNQTWFPAGIGQHSENLYFGAYWDHFSWPPERIRRDNEPFTSAGNDGMRLTTRLDGYDFADVQGIIDRSQNVFVDPSAPQYVVVDDDPAGVLNLMAELTAGLGDQACSDSTGQAVTVGVPTPSRPVIGYVSHGTNDSGELLGGDNGDPSTGYIPEQLGDPQSGLLLADGAVFMTYESFNAWTFDPWVLQPRGEGGYYIPEDDQQGLLAQWLAIGGTAGIGHVFEPEPGAYDGTVANEDIVFDMLLDGYTWAEAAWRSMQQVSFVNTVIGDPLMVWQIAGDMNGDRVLDHQDIDLLYDNLGGPGVPSAPIYDLDGDGDADIDDMTYLVRTILGSEFGDFNLDMKLNEIDLTVLATYFNTTGNWSTGDASGDGFIDLTDLTILATYYGFDGTGDAVPEPATLGLLAVGGLALLIRRRK